jgi:restriction endonuclease S subunit
MKQKIKDIAEIRSGYQFRGKVEASDDPNVAVIQIKDLGDRVNAFPGERVGIQMADLIRVRMENPEPHFLQLGDVLFLSRGHRQVAAVVSEPVTDTIATGFFFVLRPDPRKVRPAFLAWFINQPDFQETLRPLSRGTHMPLVSKADFQDLSVTLPPLAVQDGILELQNLVERERELTAALLQKRGALAQAVSQELLSGRLEQKDN